MKATRFFSLLFFLLVATASTPSQAFRVDATPVIGVNDDPHGDDDPALHAALTVGVSVASAFVVGLQCYASSFTDREAVLLAAVGRFHYMPTKAVRPYFGAGIGFMGWIEGDAVGEIMPQLAAGVEIGWREVAFVLEYSTRFNVPIPDNDVDSISIGLNFGFGK